MEMNAFRIEKDDDGRRLDRVVRRFLPEMSLSALYKLLRKGLIRVDGKKAAPDFRVSAGSELGIAAVIATAVPPPAAATGVQSAGSASETAPAALRPAPEILLETPDLLFVNKSAGIPVHGDGGLDGMIAQSASSAASLSFRTGPLHRLDRDTTGLIAFSRSLDGARWFSRVLADRGFEKYYLGLAEGIIEGEAEWTDIARDGKPMVTLVRSIANARESGGSQTGDSTASGGLTLVLFRIVTGRKHQIRIQSSLRSHPLAGDSRYGSKRKESTFYLHAWQMVFPTDRPAGLPDRLTAPLPARFISKLRVLFPADVLAQVEAGELYWEQHEEHQ